MVMHDVLVNGVQLSGATQSAPTVLQMNAEDFPGAFLRDLGAVPPPVTSALTTTARAQVSSAQAVASSASAPGTLYQPVARMLNVALVQLNCDTVGSPRLDPTRVLSAGLVVRRVPRLGGTSQVGLEADTAWPWMKNANGQFGWVQPPVLPKKSALAKREWSPQWSPDADPNPVDRPQLQSGRADLDLLLTAQSRSTSLAESSTPAFAADPAVCNAAQRTFVYALIPTASSEASTLQAPAVGQIDSAALLQILPTFLMAGSHVVSQQDKNVNYKYMSDEYARANGATDFLSFSGTLRMLHTVFGAFDGSATAQPLLDILNRYNVTLQQGSGYVQKPMGTFYQDAANKLIVYDFNDPASARPAPTLLMPHAWDFFTTADQDAIVQVMLPLLQSRGQSAAPPQGRYQDASRLYRVRMFFRIKGETPSCPPQLIWSCYSEPFRFAPWYENAGRAVAPVPLPDPFDPNTLKNSKPTSAFAVPPSLMNAMQNSSLTGLSNGTAPGGGGGIDIMWICGFSIPLITICAFFVLNIFLMLLNIVFFWLPFIKICIPFPIPAPSAATED